MYYCPRCGEALNYNSKVYTTLNRVVKGCEACLDIEEHDAEDVLDYVEENDDV